MKNIVVFGGTSEGRQVSEALSAEGIFHTLCVATSWGEDIMPPAKYADIIAGRKDMEGIKQLFISRSTQLVVDCTHPHAVKVTENIRKAAEDTGVIYWRFSRDISIPERFREGENIRIFNGVEACGQFLDYAVKTPGSPVAGKNILLTTGSKELRDFCRFEGLRDRLYVRVIPTIESLGLCMEAGIRPDRIIAMQGPFSANLNISLINEYSIGCLVTKNSGVRGGTPEKLEAVLETGILGCIIEGA